MFGSFMPQIGRGQRSKSAMFGNQEQGSPRPDNPFGQMVSAMRSQAPQMGMGGFGLPDQGMRALMPSPQNFMGMLGQMGQMGQPQMQGNPFGMFGQQRPGDLSNNPGQAGDMFRSGQIQTFGKPTAGGFRAY